MGEDAAAAAEEEATNGDEAPNAAAPKKVMFAKRVRKGNVRARSSKDDLDDDENGGASSSAVLAAKSKSRPRADAFSTVGSDDKKRDREAVGEYVGERTIQQRTDDDATRQLEIDTEKDKDAVSIRERIMENAEKKTKYDGKYKGAAGYTDHTAGFRREHRAGNDKVKGSHGPLRAPSNIRFHFRMDYQPDICKDYKETGFCGYGDNCKFLHDRGDYKSGWQIDRDWEAQQKAKAEALQKQMLEGGILNSDEEEEEGEGGSGNKKADDGLPWACFICRKPFERPVATNCGHYFCEHCALKHHANKKNHFKCAACGKHTGGSFRTATELINR